MSPQNVTITITFPFEFPTFDRFSLSLTKIIRIIWKTIGSIRRNREIGTNGSLKDPFVERDVRIVDLRQNLWAFVKRGVYKWSHLAARLFNRTATTFHPIQMDDLSLRDSITVTAITRRLSLAAMISLYNRYVNVSLHSSGYVPVNGIYKSPILRAHQRAYSSAGKFKSILFNRRVYSVFEIFVTIWKNGIRYIYIFFFFSCSQEIYKRLSVGWKH